MENKYSELSNEELQKIYDEMEIQFNGMNFEIEEMVLSKKYSGYEFLSLSNESKEIEEKMNSIKGIIDWRNQIKEIEKNNIKIDSKVYKKKI